MVDNVDINELQKIAKTFALNNNLIPATFYHNGIQSNADRKNTEDWKNESGQNANFVYGFTFFSKGHSCEKIYTKLL